MKYKKYKNNDVYEIWSEQGQFVVSCINEKTADYLLSLLMPANDNRLSIDNKLSQTVRSLLGKEK